MRPSGVRAHTVTVTGSEMRWGIAALGITLVSVAQDAMHSIAETANTILIHRGRLLLVGKSGLSQGVQVAPHDAA